MKVWMFVCARTPVSPGFSMLDPGVEICPEPGGTCAYPFPAANTAIASTPIDNRGQRFAAFQQASLIIQRNSVTARVREFEEYFRERNRLFSLFYQVEIRYGQLPSK
jgi:hypothetical protein